MKANDYLRHF
ncbi:hypothetical protein RDI58_001327 [Solanum bulbocastanum]|uniref:Uncharacterized protein n=1 Tax=Solanum bulbocastanum TaxID=147425 RepID=A0AAN8U7S6_SOLBU